MLIYAIIILIIIIIFLDYHAKSHERYVNPTSQYIRKMNDIVFDKSNINGKLSNGVSQSAINTSIQGISSGESMAPPQFSNFGIIGKIMPDPVVNSCNLDFDCTNYVYDSDDKNMPVCRRCNSNSLNVNYNDMSRPLYLMAREAGKPRQMRKIN